MITKSNYFSVKEVSCRCGCGATIKLEMLDKLNDIRKLYGKPISLTCGARCPTHNAKIGGAKNSAHISGEAVDMVRTEELLQFIKANLEVLDLYMEDPTYTVNWIHLQCRKTKTRVFKP